MSKVAIVGSRDFKYLDAVRNFVNKLPAGTVVVSGGARGVDKAAEEAAVARGLDVIVFPADWSKGKGAGFERNTHIVNEADEVVAFWDGDSKGTQDTLTKAMHAKKPVRVFDGIAWQLWSRRK